MVTESPAPSKSRRPRKTEQARRLLWLTEAQAALGWGVILILVALLGAIYLNQTSRIATVGRRVQALQINLDHVKRENASLERAIAEAQSLNRLQQDAQRLGFRRARPDDIHYLVVADYPVVAPVATTAVVLVVPEPLETMPEALWLKLQARVTDLIKGESP